MPALMVAAEVMWRRTGDAEWLALAKRWAKGTAVFFAVGAVSGTVLSFELGLLFPGFMEHAGPIVGIPFSLEGFAFFTEAIFLGLYLYGWERLSGRMHVAAGVVVALSGLASAVFVTFVNAWMNAPRGFRVENGELVDIDALGALQTPFALHEIPHTALAAYMSTSLAVGAIHAWGLLRRPGSTLHRKALGLAIAMTVPCALLQPPIGHFAGQQVAKHQPLKFAAMEQLHETQPNAPIEVGPLAVPGALSWLATGDPDAVITGLEAFPREDWPSPVVQHAFRLMVGIGSIAALYALIAIWRRWRRLEPSRWWLWATIALGPTGAIAMEAGWIVTEVGRQPWVVQGVLRTHEAATPLGTMWLPFVAFTLVYAGLGAVVAAVLYKQVRETTEPAR
jgi:cytochrome d ubiquinol oxidase subunit I